MILIACTLIACAVFGWISRGFQFYHDEWDFVLHPPSSPGDYFAPHNEHWSTVALLIYQALLHALGMRSHVPFMAAVLAMHAVSVFLLFRLVRRRSGELLALLAALLLLVFGWGADDFLWAFQVGFQGSLVFGLLALDLLDHDGRSAAPVAAVCLLASVASSGVGLAFVAAALVELLFDPSRRARAWVAAPAVAGYVAWLSVVGRTAVHPPQGLLTASTIGLLAHYVGFGIGAAGAAVVGGGIRVGQAGAYVALAVLLTLVAIAAAKRVGSRVLGAAAGLLVLFAGAGLVRAGIATYLEAGSRRYLYVGAVFVLLIVTSVAATAPVRRTAAALVGAVAAAGIAGNLLALRSPITFWNSESRTQDIVLATADSLRSTRGLDLDGALDPGLMPHVTAGLLYAAEDRFGRPAPQLPAGRLRPAEQRLVESVRRALTTR